MLVEFNVCIRYSGILVGIEFDRRGTVRDSTVVVSFYQSSRYCCLCTYAHTTPCNIGLLLVE